MTVIAWDGKYLVVDGRCTDGETATLIGDNFQKMYKLTVKGLGQCTVGLAGDCYAIGPFLEHLKENGLVPFDGMEHRKIYALIVNRKGECLEACGDGGWFPVQGKTSIGSGSIIAQHYMVKGCTAYEAVVETCKTELSCGGNITVYDSKTGTITEYTP